MRRLEALICKHFALLRIVFSISIIASCRIFPRLTTLGLGKLLDTSTSGNLLFPLISDHPLLPYSNCEFKAFSEGILIEKMDTKCLPVLICMNIHVERMWVVDAEECLSQALKLVSRRDKDLPEFIAPDGNIVVFRLKLFEDPNVRNENFMDDIEQALQCNPLTAALPGLSKRSCHHIAFFIPTGSRLAASMNQACGIWRNVLKANDIQVHRGNDVALPQRYSHSRPCIDLSYPP